MKTALQLVKKEKDKGPMTLGRGEARPLRARQGTQPRVSQSRACGRAPLPPHRGLAPADRPQAAPVPSPQGSVWTGGHWAS